ncbi:HEAT repeat domain-containing protein [Sphaerotilus uruguayifluvii]|uniref:HEAT repeat protein n=1 Tax=Sphaerotilus uruguayifluvii TaxID=2735897 RepID=A0ABX2FY10_9BURK|nr:HEAT repeat domain-containing protein [Leptothrix sp. C29]NRT54911.1 HEAT repeat protein [Leptothrix sp. C29]
MGLRKSNTPEPLREVVDRGFPRHVDGLIAQLRGGDAEQRRWAVRDLGTHPLAAAALGAQLLVERDAAVREAIFLALGTMASDEAVGALLPLLRSEDARLRNGAIEVLSGLPKVVGPRISALLLDADADVRIFTVNLLGELRHEQVTQWLQQVLLADREVNVVAAAIEVMAETGQPEHIDALRETRRRFADDPFIGFAVDVAIERIRAS